jgi:hypothetical protein
MRAFKLSLIFLTFAASSWAGEVILAYQGTNQWVAEADNAPLRKLLAAAKRGSRSFTVVLPKGERALAKQRLAVLITLLERQRAGGAVSMAEASGKTPPNTLRVQW